MLIRTFLHRSGAATVATALVAAPMTASAAPSKSRHVAKRVGIRIKAPADTQGAARDVWLSGGPQRESRGESGGYPVSTVDTRPIVRVARGSEMIEVPIGKKVTNDVTVGGKN